MGTNSWGPTQAYFQGSSKAADYLQISKLAILISMATLAWCASHLSLLTPPAPNRPPQVLLMQLGPGLLPANIR
jgi:hypothetical protein